MPEHIKKKFAKQGSMDQYVPDRYSTKYFRYQLADFDPIKAEQLRDFTYDKLTEFKWMRRANLHAANDQNEFNARTASKGSGRR